MKGKDYFNYRSRAPFTQSSGVCEAWNVRCDAFGKGVLQNHPYVIANEWVAGRIAQWLNLPVPPFILMAKKSGSTRMFGSYSFDKKQKPCDILPDICMNRLPRLCTGILLFDILIANNDRHRGNIKVDDKHSPKVVHIFDHERSLFGCESKRGKQRLEELGSHVGVSAGPVSGGNEHVFLPFEHDKEHLTEWSARISQIPDYFLEDVCQETASMGVRKSERKALCAFLKDRSTNLGSLLVKNKQVFNGSENWGAMFL